MAGSHCAWTGKLDQGAAKLEWRGSHIGITWSADGTTVLTAMQERELHGWQLTNHQTISMAGYSAKVRSMDWLRRPMMLVTSGGDCMIVRSGHVRTLPHCRGDGTAIRQGGPSIGRKARWRPPLYRRQGGPHRATRPKP